MERAEAEALATFCFEDPFAIIIIKLAASPSSGISLKMILPCANSRELFCLVPLKYYEHFSSFKSDPFQYRNICFILVHSEDGLRSAKKTHQK